MLKLLLISILLTIVYSWEEFKHALRTLAYGLLKKNPPRYYAAHIDQFVGTIVMVAAAPVGLIYFLGSQQTLASKLFWLFAGLLLVSFVSAGSAIFARRLKMTSNVSGAQKIIPLTYAVLGLFTPMFQFFTGIGEGQRRGLTKLTFYLSLPALIGLLFKYLLDYSAPPAELLPNLDAGIVVLVGALFIRIVVELLETAFRLYRLETLFSYFRILLGIALAAILTMGLV
ncbi:MAG: hypothetical protein AAB871_01940 [Patescibacteria group bacterium]